MHPPALFFIEIWTRNICCFFYLALSKFVKFFGSLKIMVLVQQKEL